MGSSSSISIIFSIQLPIEITTQLLSNQSYTKQVKLSRSNERFPLNLIWINQSKCKILAIMVVPISEVSIDPSFKPINVVLV
jgi:exonuclease I